MILLCVTALVMCSIFFAALQKSSSALVFTSRPAHTVITKWYGNNDRRVKLRELDITNDVTIHTEIEESCASKSIIIRSENIKITAYTSGRILYTSDDEGKALYGKRITVIPADDVKKGKTLYLNLSPVERRKGAVTAPVYLGTNNDYLFTLLQREAALIASVLILLAICIAAGVIAAYSKKPVRLIYLICSIAVLIVLLISRSDLFQFFIGSSEMAYVSLYSSYMLLPIPVTAFAISLTQRIKSVSILQIIICIYSVMRLLLFALFTVPLDKGLLPSHILSLLTFIAIIYLIYKKRCDAALLNLFSFHTLGSRPA